MPLITVYTTYPNTKTARKINRVLLNKKLIACANSFTVTSEYVWKGKLIAKKEIASLLKTTSKQWPAVKKEIKKMHPYEVRCIERIETSAHVEFEKWINATTK